MSCIFFSLMFLVFVSSCVELCAAFSHFDLPLALVFVKFILSSRAQWSDHLVSLRCSSQLDTVGVVFVLCSHHLTKHIVDFVVSLPTLTARESVTHTGELVSLSSMFFSTLSTHSILWFVWIGKANNYKCEKFENTKTKISEGESDLPCS